MLLSRNTLNYKGFLTLVNILALLSFSIPGLATPNSNNCLISTGVQIPNETSTPQPEPRLTNPIESRLMAMTKAEDLVRELTSVRKKYQKWKGDWMTLKTQTRLSQIIHLRSQQIGSCLN